MVVPPYGKDIEFNDIVRETGTKRKEQCFWGFINGVSNRFDNATSSMNLIPTLVDNDRVWSLINDAKLLGVGDLTVCLCLKLSIHTPIVKLGTVIK